MLGTTDIRTRARALSLGFAVAVAVGVAGLAGDSAPAQETGASGLSGPQPENAVARASNKRPNVIVVITDDQPTTAYNRRTMPFTHAFMGRQGTNFKDFIVTSPLCCPSRASFLTGEYTHNHGAWNSYETLEHPAENLGPWLKSDGYRTAMLGKWLNHYDKAVGAETTPAPGWSQWRMLLEPLSYYDYNVSVNGRRVQHGDRNRDYSTTYLNHEAVDLVNEWAPQRKPFFMWYAPHAPHDEKVRSDDGPCGGRAVPAPGDQGLFSNSELPRPPSFNENKMRDKPDFMKRLPKLNRDDVKALERLHRCRLASLREVDRGVEDIVKALRQKHDLKKTVIVFTSDNGIFEGEHRLREGKRLAYSEALRVPFAVRATPKVLDDQPPSQVGKPVANIDLAPTILDLANADSCMGGSCRIMDGRSMLPLLRRHDGSWPHDRGLVVEMHHCRYAGLRADDQAIVAYNSVPRRPGTPGCLPRKAYEHYDLKQDPYELHNKARERSDFPPTLLARFNDLKDCRGIEGRDPAPPGGLSYCE